MKTLEYENQIFLDSFHEDGLLITAKGLGVDRILQNFLKVYSDTANLVVVINTTSSEEEYFIENLEREGVKPLPRVITNEVSVSERQKVYLEGGVLFITSRILVVDFLTDRIPSEHVSGILVYRAHKVIESCQEAFILRLYRQKNKTGFIKAFSDSPHAFTSGFANVERTMKNLFVRNLYLWPRFHASVVATLEKNQIDVIEIQVKLTSTMLACQTALLDLINACIKELKRCTTAIDADEVTVENAIGKSFDKIIRFQLDPVWHQLGSKTKQLVTDIKTLRLILRHLTQYDCVTFHSMVNSVRTNEKTFGQNTGWLFLDSADSLFVHSRERIYGPQNKKIYDDENDKKTEVEPLLEPCPKWNALLDIVKEIRDEVKDADLDQCHILIAAEDDRTCNQIREVLCGGHKSLLIRLYNKSLAMKGQYLQDAKKKEREEKKTKRKAEIKTTGPELTLTQMLDEDKPENKSDDSNKLCSSKDAYYGIIDEPLTIIHPLHGTTDCNGLSKTLHEVQPRYVILYDADMQFVRELEVYKASTPGKPLRVYFLMYTGSVEEQRYLTTLRKEKEAFEYLISEKSAMVIPEEREGKMEDDPNLARDTTPANATVNTRKGGLHLTQSQQKVIVDMREFRSELPSLIHRRGIDIEPVTIEVGDYILTPDICVERKSVSDLIGSLNNGRLYNQCVSMCRYYKRPVLLIEFDTNKSFALQGKYPISSDVSIQDVSSRLTLLTLHFPKLRILWCQSPYVTAEMFEELKQGRQQPDAEAAMKINSAEADSEWTERYSHNPQDFLLRMPGVNIKNYRKIMNKVENIAELCSMSEDQIGELLDNKSSAKLLYDFIHTDHKQSEHSGKAIKAKDLKKTLKRKKMITTDV